MTLKPHAILYRYQDGREYTVDIYATSKADARARIRTAYLTGEPQEIVWSDERPDRSLTAQIIEAAVPFGLGVLFCYLFGGF